MVVLPEDSGPKTSVTRPRGMPPTPRAASKLMEPVEITAMGSSASREPSRTIDPFPNCFSICARASSTALVRSSAMAMGGLLDLFVARVSCFLHRKPWGGMNWISMGL